jgi:hypothetical protein
LLLFFKIRVGFGNLRTSLPQKWPTNKTQQHIFAAIGVQYRIDEENASAVPVYAVVEDDATGKARAVLIKRRAVAFRTSTASKVCFGVEDSEWMAERAPLDAGVVNRPREVGALEHCPRAADAKARELPEGEIRKSKNKNDKERKKKKRKEREEASNKKHKKHKEGE